MKKILISLIIIILMTTTVVSAHPGRTDSGGGHTCRTNCPSWGLNTGQYHYHGGSSTSNSSHSGSSSSGSSTTDSYSNNHSSSTSTSSSNTQELKLEKQPTVNIYINAKLVSFDQEPIIINGNTLVPMRGVFEALGATIEWKNETQTVILSKENIIVSLKIGEKLAIKNDVDIEISQPAILLNNKTMVPIRFVSKSLGAKVIWDQKNHSVFIDY